ncbi:MAG: hypothetical protein ABEJ26_06765 [Halosimplex sp.]
MGQLTRRQTLQRGGITAISLAGLPAPEGGMRFAARFYGPRWSLVDGSYDMPEVVPAEG